MKCIASNIVEYYEYCLLNDTAVGPLSAIVSQVDVAVKRIMMSLFILFVRKFGSMPRFLTLMYV